MLQTATIGKKHLALLGLLCFKHEPEVANRLLETYVPHHEPIETDHGLISQYFKSFCQIQAIDPEDYIGSLYKSSKVDIRRRFIAVILHIYCPQVYTQPLDNIILNKGIVKTLCSVLKSNSKGSMSGTIREVIIWEKQYEEFASTVADITLKLTSDGSTEGK